MSSPNLPTTTGSDDFSNEVEMKFSNVDGSVRASVVNKLRRLIDKNPEQFVKGMRRYMHEGTGRDE